MAQPDDDQPRSEPSVPAGGRLGRTVVSVVPIVALALFFLFGADGGWAWSWLFFLAVPIAWIAVYGTASPIERRQR